MGIIGWIFFGLLVGAVGKLLMPGRDPGGFVVTILLGTAGALIGGFLGRALGMYRQDDPVGFVMAVLGSIVLLVLYRLTFARRSIWKRGRIAVKRVQQQRTQRSSHASPTGSKKHITTKRKTDTKVCAVNDLNLRALAGLHGEMRLSPRPVMCARIYLSAVSAKHVWRFSPPGWNAAAVTFEAIRPAFEMRRQCRLSTLGRSFLQEWKDNLIVSLHLNQKLRGIALAAFR